MMRENDILTRRQLLNAAARTGVAMAMASALSCVKTHESGSRSGIVARPALPTREPPPFGLSRLGIGSDRDGLLYVPRSYRPDAKTPLMVLLHGAGGAGESWTSFPDRAERHGMILLMPDSRGSTWDLLLRQLGPDLEFLQLALAETFSRCNIDPSLVCLAGFSDGATYALTIGLSHGDLFRHIIAYSPGFLAFPTEPVGRPRIFDSHGDADRILPVASSRDRVVPTLRTKGYDVTYREFAGGHGVPGAIADESIGWFLRK